MKKNCNFCRALLNKKCTLGYRIVVDKTEDYTVVRPMQKCPKPLNKSEFAINMEKVLNREKLNNLLAYLYK